MVENPGFWNWTFTLKDDEENVLAQIDRDWRGLGLEVISLSLSLSLSLSISINKPTRKLELYLFKNILTTLHYIFFPNYGGGHASSSFWNVMLILNLVGHK